MGSEPLPVLQSASELEWLFTLSPDLIVVLGFDGYLKRVNPAFQERLGYTELEALTRPSLDFVHPDDRERTEAERTRICEGARIVSFVNRYVCKDGSYRWIEWTSAPALEQRVLYAVGRDVTERRQAETDLRLAEERNRTLAEAQAALRRLATLVARGASPQGVVAATATEVRRLLGPDFVALSRYESDGSVIILAHDADSDTGAHLPAVGERISVESENATGAVLRTGRAARVEGFDEATGPVAELARRVGFRSSVGAPIIVEGRLWGAIVMSLKRGRFPADIEQRLVDFTDLVATAIGNAESRAGLASLAEEQAALRRVATLVARGVPPPEVFAAVVEEVGQLLQVGSAAMGRYDADGVFTTVAAWSMGSVAFPVGGRWIPEGKNVMTIVWETGRPARVDDFADASGPVGIAAREAGYRSAVGTPVIVEGRLWGVVTAASSADQPLPVSTEARLASFTELVATAIANAESRAALGVLVDEQAALRRVATLVARGTSPMEVFAAVAKEVGQFVSIDGTRILRYETDDTATVVSAWSEAALVPAELKPGSRLTLDGESIAALVLRTGRPARVDSYEDSHGWIAVKMRKYGFRSAAGAPIVVDGRLWGVMAAVSSQVEPLPVGLESRIGQFTELVAMAIANAEGRGELTASRARIVAASDNARRRIERDLHDGAQQRLVALGLDLRAAEQRVPAVSAALRAELSRAAEGLGSILDDLREMSRGIHPAILAEGGLGPALKILARRSPIPVKVEVRAQERLPEPIEVAVYYVVSEALTNAAKHAHASVVHVKVANEDSIVQLTIRDDGVGGADPAQGSGLIGLSDRVEALGGRIEIASPADRGTSLLVTIPIESD